MPKSAPRATTIWRRNHAADSNLQPSKAGAFQQAGTSRDSERKYKGETTMAVISISTFPGSLACALTVTDRRDGKTCSQFTVYADDLPGLHEYIQAHNAGDGEFKVDLG